MTAGPPADEPGPSDPCARRPACRSLAGITNTRASIGAAPVLVGIVGAASVEAALRRGFERAEACGAAVHVVCAGQASAADDAFLGDLIDRWAEKFPHVRIRIRICRTVDAA